MTAAIAKAIRDDGYVLLEPPLVEQALEVPLLDLAPLRPSWNNLAKDAYLRDGGSYRARRHSCFVYTPAAQRLTLAPHRAHWQPIDRQQGFQSPAPA